MASSDSISLSAARTLSFGKGGDRVLRVEAGCVELFFVWNASALGGRRYHLASFPEGTRLYDVGFSGSDSTVSLLAVGQAGTVVGVADPSTDSAADSVGDWLTRIASGIADISDWTHSSAGCEGVRGDDWSGELARIHGEFLAAIRKGMEAREAGEFGARERRSHLRESVGDAAWTEIASVLAGEQESLIPTASSPTESLVFAFGYAARLRGIVPNLTGRAQQGGASSDAREVLARMARESSVRLRTVLLEGAWFRRDNGPLIGFLEETGEAVVLVPRGRKGTTAHLADGSYWSVTKKNVTRLSPFACCIYRSLPDRRLSLRDIVRFSLWGNNRDIVMLVGMVVLTGLLGLVTPALTGRIFDLIVPQAERQLMVQIGVALLSAALIRSLLELVRGIALLRIQNRTDVNLQAAVWDRLLKLPVRFFRKYTAGDLATRAQGVSEMHDILSSTGTTVLFSLPVGVFNFLVMFRYNMTLSLWGLGLALLSLVVSVFLNARQIVALRSQYDVQGRLAGLVFQLINGVAKFRIAGAERLAFSAWAREYAKQERYSVRAGRWGVVAHTFFSGYSLLTSLVIFAVVAGLSAKGSEFTTGTFLAFNAAFGALVGSLVSMGDNSLALLRLFPLMERTKPIFDAASEVALDRVSPGPLGGGIEMANIRFRYTEDTPPTLEDFSLRVAPGEFVALVGPSGSGKSTILRLLLGFETPDSGTIFYDGKDLQTLDLREVRRQIGVVMQSSSLVPGDIFRNIVGESSLTLDDAWRAAEMAGLADDIRAMPMQMHTVISEGGAGFSGGQKQRLAIARALVHSPRLLYFDEATSALDNRTQAVVTESLEALKTTRLVIAHRLSTIIQADRIIVLRAGRIIEEGSYTDLMARRGFFHELATRQLAPED